MNNIEEALLKRNAGLHKFFSENASAYTADAAFTEQKEKFTADYEILLQSAANANPDNSGYSKEKVNAKIAAAEFVTALAASAQVKLQSLGKISVANSIHSALRYYKNPADTTSLSRLAEAHTILQTNLPYLTPDYITAEDLATLQTLIDNFVAAHGSSADVHAIAPVLTAKFKSALKAVNKHVLNLGKLGKKYKALNKPFFNGLMAASKIPAINIRHTTLLLTVVDKFSGLPIQGAGISITNSSKKGVTNADGTFKINRIHVGNPTLTITATGYTDYHAVIHIASGKENVYNITLEEV